ncbi:MAG: hypothetical protein GY832_35250 [Chloroflexi bacterium]|nr:hypothetical protein [Chloroflexota bacterium]
MSKISEISKQYHDALLASQEQYEDLYRERAEATERFYQDFFKGLICDFGARFQNERFRARLQDQIGRTLGTDTLSFIAIDGTCRREVFSDMITFFGGAYGARGQIAFSGSKHQLQYQRWSLEQDVSMVAWVPVPFANLDEVTQDGGEQFLVTEQEKVNLSSVHIQIMQLAEIFLAYNTIQSSRLEAPHILLMDLSPSSVLASVARAQRDIGLEGYPYDRRALTPADITIALSRPFSDYFKIPSLKKMDLYRFLVQELSRAPDESLDLKALSEKYAVSLDDLKRAAKFLVERGVIKRPRLGNPGYQPVVRVDESWAYTRDFFQNICERLFVNKDSSALRYDAPDERGVMRRRWMSPDDLGFLIGVGMRLLIEACWERKVLFYGVVKDSSSRYLTRNFLGVSLETGFHPELQDMDVGILPWTDRIFCETLPLIDETLSAPWCTIEFDSAFMTLHREKVGDTDRTQVAGIMGRIVNQERLFVRSLGQFFLKRDKRTPMMGHVVFLERLLSPVWDWPGKDQGPAEMKIDTPQLGRFSVYGWHDQEHTNPGQRVMMYLLSVLTRNHFAEAIGYPDPLHKADWGAKTIGRSVAKVIQSSTQYLRSRPLSRTFRDIRDKRRR